MKQKKKPELKNKTHGAMLADLKEWWGERSVSKFCKKIGFSDKWYYEAVKDEIIPKQSRIEISRALNIDLEYWDGKTSLPLHPVRSPDSITVGTTREHQLELELAEFKTKYITALEKIEALHDEVIRLQREHKIAG